MKTPILYSFKRCPYAMRARMAIKLSNINCELREIRLNNKPKHMLEVSPKGTVPVLVLEERIIDETFINYTIVENDNEINIFFNNKTFNLVGWQTKDLYQNLNVTNLFSIERNKKVAKNLFSLPLQN